MDPGPDHQMPTASQQGAHPLPCSVGCPPCFPRHLPRMLTRVERCGQGSETHNYSAVSRRQVQGCVSVPFLSSLTLLGTSLPIPPTLPSLLGGIVMVVMAASSLFCPPPHSHHHLPLPHPPSNICAFRGFRVKIYCQTTLAFRWPGASPWQGLWPQHPQNLGPYSQSV